MIECFEKHVDKPSDDMDILIDESGNIRYVYTDALDAVFADDERMTVRASHVEPHQSGHGWIADMRPSGGPVLGHGREYLPVDQLPLEYLGPCDKHFVSLLPPFVTRQEALDAEREWLRKEKGL